MAMGHRLVAPAVWVLPLLWLHVRMAARRGALRASPRLCNVLVYIASTSSDGLNLGRPSGGAGGPRRLSSHNIIYRDNISSPGILSARLV